MKNKKFIVMIILIITLISVALIYCNKSEKQKNIIGKEEHLKEDEYTLNTVEENKENIVEEKPSQEENEESQEEINDSSITEVESNSNQTLKPEEESKQQIATVSNIQANKKQTEEKKEQPRKVQVSEQTSITQPIEKKEEPTIKKEETIDNTPKCNHGNQKFYNTKTEAIALYELKIHEWGEKWTNYQIDDETYHKNCPVGYEIMSCPICEKWAIDMYYSN